MMYLAAGCPVLAVVEPQSELAQLVRSHNLGVTATQNPLDITNAILSAYEARRTLNDGRRKLIRETGNRLFGRRQMLASWTDLLLEEERAWEVRRAA